MIVSNLTISELLKVVLELSKVRISLLVSLSTAAGFILAEGALSAGIFLPTLAVFILASGSAALNHVQEYIPDGKMARTSARPVPSGKVTPHFALSVAILFIVVGSLLLLAYSNTTAFSLGLLNVFWYNVIYTPLKKRTPLAVIPGALIGAIPPAIGWSAAGGKLHETYLLTLALFFFIWQIPHFWLLLLKFGKEYERAGYPSLTATYSNKQIGRFTYFWLIVTVISCLAIPVFKADSSIWIFTGLLLLNLWVLWGNKNLLRIEKDSISLTSSFININIYIMLVMTLLVLERIYL
jgi:protoheme IX farnesyltransferase